MPKKQTSPPQNPPEQATEPAQPTEDRATLMAQIVLYPTAQAAVTLSKYNEECGALSLNELVKQLGEQVQRVKGGRLERSEEMLTAQAHTLDAIFHVLARRAVLNMGECMGACETYLKLALRAQSQCRSSWEAIAAIKNPPLAGYVKQANIAHGHQQVNNASASDASRARETENPPNQVLEQHDGERLDPRAPQAAGATDSDLETVGTLNRSKNTRR